MWITAYSNAYVKMMSKETTTENGNTSSSVWVAILFAQEVGLGQLEMIFNEGSWCTTPYHISWLLLVYHEACYVVQCNTTRPSHT